MRILVIGPSWVGDMMMSHSLYQSLKQQYSDCVIDVLAPNWCCALLSRMPEVRNAIAMPIGHGEFDLKQRYQIGKSLRGQYDLAIVLPNSFKSALIPLFAKIPVRRGWKGESRYFVLNDLRSNKQDYPLMVQRYVTLAYEQGAIPAAKDLSFSYPYLQTEPDQVAATLAQFCKKFAIDTERKKIGFCPGAEFGPAKRWPHYHYADLAKLLINKGYQVLLFGSAKDQAVGEEICQSLTEEERAFCINIAGETSLPQAIDLLASCDGVVSNDSGLMHITAALKRPLVAVYGPTSPEYTPPLSERVKVIRLISGGLIKVRKSKDSQEGYHQSLIDIQPQLVLEELEKLL